MLGDEIKNCNHPHGVIEILVAAGLHLPMYGRSAVVKQTVLEVDFAVGLHLDYELASV